MATAAFTPQVFVSAPPSAATMAFTPQVFVPPASAVMSFTPQVFVEPSDVCYPPVCSCTLPACNGA